jgi:hypothetical protein
MTKNRKSCGSSDDARAKSWLPGRKGLGGEGLSKGYGGSTGDATGASGPEAGKRSKPADDEALDEKFDRGAHHSPSLPSREKIAKVLR